MISKDTFCKILDTLYVSKTKSEDIADGIFNAVAIHRPSITEFLAGYQLETLFSDTDLIDSILRILEEELEDTQAKYIDYFVWELDFGKKEYAKDCITLEDGKTVSLQTPEQLYDFLIKNIKERRVAEIFGEPQEIHKSYTKGDIQCFDYTGIDDKIELQLFTGMFFKEVGNSIKGYSAEYTLTVNPGETVIKLKNGRVYSLPKSVIERL